MINLLKGKCNVINWTPECDQAFKQHSIADHPSFQKHLCGTQTPLSLAMNEERYQKLR